LLNFSVIGGFSKMLKYFERKYSPKNILSYANRRWSQGNVYESLQFEFIKDTNPNHFYVIKNKLESRIKYQKHKLDGILNNFDSNLTAWENLRREGFLKIYDCGNKLYIKQFKSL